MTTPRSIRYINAALHIGFMHFERVIRTVIDALERSSVNDYVHASTGITQAFLVTHIAKEWTIGIEVFVSLGQ
jgi:hypothetical protein